MEREAQPGLRLTDAPIEPPLERRPPAGAPNIVVIVLDDTGFAQLGAFGSDISTPSIDALAYEGLRYNRFHVTSLCSPTRASFLTGRNHHAVGMGFLADIPLSYPGYTGRIPKTAATLPRILKDAGYSTIAVGKWHLTPRWQRSAAGPFDTWPLGLGFERYYGFLQAGTNHWTPNLVCDNHYIDPPASPRDGYHLSEDLASQAERLILDQQNGAPGKPFFLYFALGAMHAPHHVSSDWVAPYHTKFDSGWDTWRKEVFSRQVNTGVVPEGTTLTPRPSWVEAWDDLSADERRMHAREQEVFAGFLTHTDAQIGRVLKVIDDVGQRENTIVVLFSDNGASAEGGKDGSVNEHRFTARIRESMDDNLSAYDDWGGFNSYNHYSWAWAWAGNTPFRLWKRYTWLGGTRTPLIVRWPAKIADPGALRSQFVHVVDLMPTILDAVGIEAPANVDGVDQQPVDGASIKATFKDPAARDARATQYFEMLGSRSIYHNGFKATTNFISSGVIDEEELAVGSREFDDDRWELFDLGTDFSESNDLAEERGDVVRSMEDLWLVEAARNQVLPIDGKFTHLLEALVPPAYPPGGSRSYKSGAGPVVDESIPLLFGGFQISAMVSVRDEPRGVIFALGDWNGGYAMYVANGRLTFSFSRAGELIEIEGDRALLPGKETTTLKITYVLDGVRGRFTLYQDDDVVGSTEFTGMLPVALQHGGAALRIGYDSGFPVSKRYEPPFPWNGEIELVTFDTPGPSLEARTEIRSALHGD
ncbi:MAG: arylsulfatase [Acidimicrobiales bacterium]